MKLYKLIIQDISKEWNTLKLCHHLTRQYNYWKFIKKISSFEEKKKTRQFTKRSFITADPWCQ